jgi:serine/threonine protein kinase
MSPAEPLPCPSREELIALQLGKLSADAQAVAAHVDGCPHCQTVLETTPLPDDSLLLALRQPFRPAAHADEPAQRRLAEAAEAVPRALGNRAFDPYSTAAGSDDTGSSAPSGPTPLPLPRQFGRYRILKKLGKGGMGHVYLAHDTRLDVQVALKVPEFAHGEDPELLERFYREARAAAQINDPHLCRVFDVSAIDGTHYLTMQYVEGQSLAEWLSGGKRLTESQAVALTIKVAEALEKAHQKGIIHRDLKPSNIMLTGPDGAPEPVIVDFGLAWRARDPRVTGIDQVLGTPAYMPPEQVDCSLGAVSPRCDVYSLGVILYQLLTGRLPFPGAKLAALLKQICHDDPEPPSKHRPDLDRRLEALCLRAIARRPEDRFGNMAELAAALREVLQTPEDRSSRPDRTAATSPRRRKFLGLAVVAAALLLALAAWLAWPESQSPDPTPPEKLLLPLALYWHGFVQRQRDDVWEEHTLCDGMTLYDGDQFRIVFSTNADCHVYIVGVDPRGDVSVLFPSKDIRQGNRVQGNRQYEIPDGDKWFELDKQTGTETLYLLASYDVLTDLEQLLAKEGPDRKKLEGLVRGLEERRVQTRGGETIDLRGVTIAADKRTATARLDSGKEAARVMERVLGSVSAVQRVRFEHLPRKGRKGE